MNKLPLEVINTAAPYNVRQGDDNYTFVKRVMDYRKREVGCSDIGLVFTVKTTIIFSCLK